MKLSALLVASFAVIAVEAGGKKKKTAVPVVVPPPRPPPPPPLPAPAVEYSEPIVSCPVGFTLNPRSRQCESEMLSRPMLSCEVGELNGNVCVAAAAVIPTCPPGYTQLGDICSSPVSSPALPVCPRGFSDAGDVCSKTVPAPVIQVCPAGEKVGDGMCCTTHTRPALFTAYCPEGYEDEDGECCRIETYDCTPPGSHSLECGDDQDCWAQKGHGSLLRRHLAAASHVSISVPPINPRASFQYEQGPAPSRNIEGVPYRFARASTSAFAPPTVQGFSSNDGIMGSHWHHGPIKETTKEMAVIQQTCQKKIIAPMLRSPYCEGGAVLEGNICVTKEFIPVENRCIGSGDEYNCFKIERAPYEQTCPAGYTLSGATCTTTDQVSAIPTCPPGFSLGYGSCTRTLEAVPYCDMGSVLGPGGYCTRTEFAPPTVSKTTLCTGEACLPRPRPPPIPRPVPVPVPVIVQSKKGHSKNGHGHKGQY